MIISIYFGAPLRHCVSRASQLCGGGMSGACLREQWFVLGGHIVSAALACGMVRYLPELDGIKSVVLAEEDYEHK